MKFIHKSRGFTLVELMIAIFVGLIISAAAIALFISMYKANTDYLKSIRLNHGLRAALVLMANDIRRTGHNRSAAADMTTNPFSASATNTLLTIPDQGTPADTADDHTIYLSYDAEADGNVEAYGYRLNNGAIQACFRQDGSPCSAGGATWEAVTDSDLIEITSLTFVENHVDVGGVQLREVSINAAGRLKKDTAFQRSLSEVVKVRNEHSLDW
jgi:prepilin-type N-terminal cleavage/methylation domain-containing protein